jgi:hypothetical protein
MFGLRWIGRDQDGLIGFGRHFVFIYSTCCFIYMYFVEGGSLLFAICSPLLCSALLCSAGALFLRGPNRLSAFSGLKGGQREFTTPLGPRLRPAVAPSVTLSGPKK